MSATNSHGGGRAEDLKVGDFIARSAAPIPRLYGDALLAAAKADPRIVCLNADLLPPTENEPFRDHLPERFFNLGIAEANMIGIAAGMARIGDRPFVHSFCVFATKRCYDQISMQIAYPKLDVTIVGFLPGITTLLGVTHQALEDIALMRATPNMAVVEPESPAQLAGAVDLALAHRGPLYLRMKRPDGPLPADFAPRPIRLGKLEMRREGRDGAIVASGMMVGLALAAAAELAHDGLQVGVVNMATIKPLDPDLADLAREAGTIVTAENHSIIGGLGSAVAELLLEAGVRVNFERVGIRDRFAEGGSTPYLFEKYGISAASIAAGFRKAKAKGR